MEREKIQALIARYNHQQATPDDIRALAEPVIAHRLVLTPELEGDAGARTSVVDDTLAKVGYRRAVRPV